MLNRSHFDLTLDADMYLLRCREANCLWVISAELPWREVEDQAESHELAHMRPSTRAAVPPVG